jgi:hypothetical protein
MKKATDVISDHVLSNCCGELSSYFQARSDVLQSIEWHTIGRFQQPYSIGTRNTHSARSPSCISTPRPTITQAEQKRGVPIPIIYGYTIYPFFYFHTALVITDATDDTTGALTITETTVREYSLVRRTLGI